MTNRDEKTNQRVEAKDQYEYCLEHFVHIIYEDLMLHKAVLQKPRNLVQESNNPVETDHSKNFEWVQI